MIESIAIAHIFSFPLLVVFFAQSLDRDKETRKQQLRIALIWALSYIVYFINF